MFGVPLGSSVERDLLKQSDALLSAHSRHGHGLSLGPLTAPRWSTWVHTNARGGLSSVYNPLGHLIGRG